MGSQNLTGNLSSSLQQDITAQTPQDTMFHCKSNSNRHFHRVVL